MSGASATSFRLDTRSRNECFNLALVVSFSCAYKAPRGLQAATMQTRAPGCPDQYVRQWGAAGRSGERTWKLGVGGVGRTRATATLKDLKMEKNVPTNFDFFQLFLSLASLWRQSVVSQWGGCRLVGERCSSIFQ